MARDPHSQATLIISLLIAVTILWILQDASFAVFRRLLDGIEPSILGEVEHAPPHVGGVREVHEARARWVGHKARAELQVAADPGLILANSHAITDRVVQSLADHVPAFGGATVHVCPDSRAAGAVSGR